MQEAMVHPLLFGFGGWPELSCLLAPVRLSSHLHLVHGGNVAAAGRGSSPQDAVSSLGILGPVVMLGWDRDRERNTGPWCNEDRRDAGLVVL